MNRPLLKRTSSISQRIDQERNDVPLSINLEESEPAKEIARDDGRASFQQSFEQEDDTDMSTASDSDTEGQVSDNQRLFRLLVLGQVSRVRGAHPYICRNSYESSILEDYSGVEKQSFLQITGWNLCGLFTEKCLIQKNMNPIFVKLDDFEILSCKSFCIFQKDSCF